MIEESKSEDMLVEKNMREIAERQRRDILVFFQKIFFKS